MKKPLKCKVGTCSQCGQDVHGGGPYPYQQPRPGQVIVCLDCLAKTEPLQESCVSCEDKRGDDFCKFLPWNDTSYETALEKYIAWQGKPCPHSARRSFEVSDDN